MATADSIPSCLYIAGGNSVSTKRILKAAISFIEDHLEDGEEIPMVLDDLETLVKYIK